MNSKIFNSFVLVVCGMMFWLITADVSGRWAGQVDYNGTPVDLAFDFKADGNKLTGTAFTPLGNSEIKDGKIEKDIITFKLDINGETVTHVGKAYPDSINLKINYQGMDLTTTLKRTAK